MRSIIISLFCMVSLNLHALSIDGLGEQEIKAFGLEKLSTEEKAALNSWLVAKTAPQAPENGKIVHGEFTIVDVKELGRFVLLENGQLYDVTSRSRKKTVEWKPGDKVRVIEPIKLTSYKLEHISKKQTVAAKAP